MTLEDFKQKWGYRYKDLVEILQYMSKEELTVAMVQNWINNGAIVNSRGRKVYALFYPAKKILSSEAYELKSKEMGVNQ